MRLLLVSMAAFLFCFCDGSVNDSRDAGNDAATGEDAGTDDDSGVDSGPDPWWDLEIVVATGGTRDELQVAVDSVQGKGVVIIPPGLFDLSGTVDVSTDGMVIIGAGNGETTLRRTEDESSSLISLHDASGVRISGLTLEGNVDVSSDAWEIGMEVIDAPGFRIDHCHFSHIGNAGILTSGSSYGVVDNASFDEIYKPGIGNVGYGVAVYGSGTMESVEYGSHLAVFIEDSSFRMCRHAVASNNGSRYVFRHNTVTENQISHAIDAHGHEYWDVGSEWSDINNNRIDLPMYSLEAVRIRGGQGLVWDNDISGYDIAVRLLEQTDQETGPIFVWNNNVNPSGALVVHAPPVSSPIPPADGVPLYETNPPDSYTPFPYPHCLAVNLVSNAGPDMKFMTEGDTGIADVYLDASASGSRNGGIIEHGWFIGQTLVSDSAVDVISLIEGTHLVLAAVEDTVGARAFDLAIVTVVPEGPLASSQDWEDLWFIPIVDESRIEFDISPSDNSMDGYVAVTGRHSVGSHEDNAVIIRLNSSGHFDARNGANYESENSISYSSGETYHVEVDVSISQQKYSASVNGMVLATGYGFRRSEVSLGRLNAWHSSGGLVVSGIVFFGN